MEYLFGLLALVGITLATYIDQNVQVVEVERFEGNLDNCVEGEVCADEFNFTRWNDDGTGRLESRFIKNCRCSNGDCGRNGDPLRFRETNKQSAVTCEDARMFPVCQPGEIAKEEHNIGTKVYYTLNCVCPNNDNPGDFRTKMTVEKRWYMMDENERAYFAANPRSRFYMCRD